MDHRQPDNRPQALEVLVIEDETILSMELEDILEELGCHVLGVASHPRRAIEVIENLHLDLDCVFLDADLAGQSARCVADCLSEHGIPYVLVSGFGPRDLRRMGFYGAALRKPYDPRQIAGALRNVAR